MPRWSTRLRRAASILLGVHLLQVVLLAASAVCDPVTGGASHDSLTMAPPVIASVHAPSSAPHTAHEAPVAANHHGHHHVPASSADAAHPSSPDTAPAPHHAPSGAPCPMAMACTVTAIVAPVPTIATREVFVATERVTERTTAPRSTRVAPEPPPPRG